MGRRSLLVVLEQGKVESVFLVEILPEYDSRNVVVPGQRR